MNHKNTPRGCHPVIAAIRDWQYKIAWPKPGSARILRAMKKRGIKCWHMEFAESIPMATTYGLPEYNYATGFHVKGNGNEFVNHPELLEFVCHNGPVG